MSSAGAGALTLERDARPDASPDRRAPWTRAEIAAAVANLLIACAIVGYFHNRFWWPPDDGAYAYVADRLRSGAVLNRDLHDIHGGYVHFVHALALDLFGRDLLSLRYPLALLTVLQSAIVFLLLRPLIGAAAIAGGVAMASLTFVQFLNPTANWYALFLAVIVAALLAAPTPHGLGRLLAIGCTVGLLFFFRQLTGVLVGMGTLVWLLVAEGGKNGSSNTLLARGLAAVMAVGLALYAWQKLDPTAILLYAACPFALLGVAGFRTRLDDGRLIQILAALLAGAMLSAIPLLLYHLANGSLAGWWQDTVVSAVALTDLDFIGDAHYATLVLLALREVAAPASAAGALNGIFWILILLAPAALGVGVIRAGLRGEPIAPLAAIALFHAVVSAHYAIPIYAFYSAGLTLAALLAMTRTPAVRAATAAALLLAATIGVMFQAAQPLSRGVVGALQGERVALDRNGLPGASIWMERSDRTTYLEILSFIDAHAPRGEPILGLPVAPEIYFLSGRQAALPFVIAPLALLSDADVERTAGELQVKLPAVLIFRPNDKYTTPRVRALMDRLRPHYRLCRTVAGFELFAPDCAPGEERRGV